MHSKRIKEKVKHDYNEIAESFSGTRRFPWRDFERFLPYYDEKSRVLDLGCGNGRLLKFLEKHGYKSYLGVDQSEGLLAFAKKNHPKDKFLLADMSELPKTLEKVDAIFAIASFHHIPPQQQLKTLKAWKNLLNDDGVIFMTNWNLLQPRFWPIWMRTVIAPRYGLRGLLIPWHAKVNRYYYAFSKRRLKVLFKKAGFEILEHDYVLHGETASFLKGQNILSILRK